MIMGQINIIFENKKFYNFWHRMGFDFKNNLYALELYLILAKNFM